MRVKVAHEELVAGLDSLPPVNFTRAEELRRYLRGGIPMPQCTVYKVNAIQDATGRWHEVQQHRCRNRVCKGSLESELSNCDAKGGSQGDNECDMVCGAHFAKAERAWYDSAYGDDGFMVGFGTTWGRS